jgi:hypothetical protein
MVQVQELQVQADKHNKPADLLIKEILVVKVVYHRLLAVKVVMIRQPIRPVAKAHNQLLAVVILVPQILLVQVVLLTHQAVKVVHQDPIQAVQAHKNK